MTTTDAGGGTTTDAAGSNGGATGGGASGNGTSDGDGGANQGSGSTGSGGSGTSGAGASGSSGGGSGPGIDQDAAPDGANTGLSPDLSLAADDGTICADGALGYGGCGAGQACRFYSPSENHCDPVGGALLGDSCADSSECDSLFVCFMGQCSNFCTLGTTECGAPTDCVDVGHPNKGACLPF